MSEAIIQPVASGGRMLLLVVGLLMLPFAIGGALYFGGWQPAKTANHGLLLSPPQAMPDELLRSTAEIRGKWLLLLKLRGACDTDCATRLDEMRRIQVALNKNMGRLRRVVLTDQPNDPALTTLRSAQPDLLIVDTPAGGLADTEDSLIIADPDGQLIMTYRPDASAQGVRADLERLLKFAWTG